MHRHVITHNPNPVKDLSQECQGVVCLHKHHLLVTLTREGLKEVRSTQVQRDLNRNQRRGDKKTKKNVEKEGKKITEEPGGLREGGLREATAEEEAAHDRLNIDAAVANNRKTAERRKELAQRNRDRKVARGRKGGCSSRFSQHPRSCSFGTVQPW